MKKIGELIGKYKYPLIVILVGLVLILTPGSSGNKSSDSASQLTDEQRLETALERADGVGEAKVLLSDNGVIIICSGAQDASVRLAVTKAAAAFTGFSSDKIQVMKISEVTE